MNVHTDAFSQPPRVLNSPVRIPLLCGLKVAIVSLPLCPRLVKSFREVAQHFYLLSSGLMACGLMGPVRMGLVVEMGGLSGSGRSFTT